MKISQNFINMEDNANPVFCISCTTVQPIALLGLPCGGVNLKAVRSSANQLEQDVLVF
ncbi:MAG TPA: hypothetical protein V6D10_02675 [Trichocoleus sp.]